MHKIALGRVVHTLFKNEIAVSNYTMVGKNQTQLCEMLKKRLPWFGFPTQTHDTDGVRNEPSAVYEGTYCVFAVDFIYNERGLHTGFADYFVDKYATIECPPDMYDLVDHTPRSVDYLAVVGLKATDPDIENKMDMVAAELERYTKFPYDTEWAGNNEYELDFRRQ